MKQRFRFMAGAAALIAALLFTACPLTEDDDTLDDGKNDGGSTQYAVTVKDTEHGAVTAKPAKAPAGTLIQLTVSPDSGYKLEGDLVATPDIVTINPNLTFYMPAVDVEITAEFEAVLEGNYTVSIDTGITHGRITAEPSYGVSGTEITLTIIPDAGYGLSADTLKHQKDDGTGITSIEVDGVSASFVLPGYNVKVTAQFVAKQAGELVTLGLDALKNGQVDTAIASFDAAYAKDNKKKEAIVYSALGKLASIAADQKVKDLMINHFGLSRYPGTVGGLIAVDDWFDTYYEEYPVYGYNDEKVHQWVYWYDSNPGSTGNDGPGYYYWDNSSLSYKLASSDKKYDPSKSPPLGLPDWFKNTKTYKNTLVTIGEDQLQTTATWPLLLFANLLDKNTAGLNGILDGVIDSVFGTSFNEAVTRVGTLAYTDSIELDSDIAEALGLDSLFDGDDIYIGKAELDLLISSLRIVKATLEWIAAYDWNTGDLSFLKANWDEDLLDISNLSGILPLKTDFLKDRKNGNMEKSRQDFILAIKSTVAAYDYYIGTNSKLPTGVQDVLKDYTWVKNGLTKLQNAMEGPSTFYVKASGGSYDVVTTAADADYGINMAKFFNPGQLAIANLVETESDGTTAPQFYGFGEGDPVKINETADFGKYDAVGFNFNLKPVKEIVLKGLELPSDNDLFQDLLSPDIGQAIYELYHK